jgi:Holliday junction resolvase RusA-like endonuclease
MYEFEIIGKVKGKQRPRVFYNAEMGRSQAITPKETVNYENWVKTCFLAKYKNVIPTEEPLSVIIEAYFVKPKSNKAICPTTVRLDCDNVAKIILDSLNGIAYKDDKQIMALHVYKKWGDMEMARVTINNILMF